MSIKELARIISEVVGYSGEVLWDKSKPDGTPRKLLDVTKLKGLGWSPQIGLEAGIEATYAHYSGRRPDFPCTGKRPR